MSYETLLVQKDGGVGVITMNRPDKLNSISTAMFTELPAAVTEMAEDPSVRTVILTGNGRAFCAGADLSGDLIARGSGDSSPRGQAATMAAEMRELQKTIFLMRRMSKPIIGAINGDAVGAGFSIALACDMRIVSEKARFGMVFARVGLVPDFGGAYFLPRIVGTAKACELILSGDVFDAAEANRLGIANKVVPPNDLPAAAMQLARRLAGGPPLAAAMAKDMIYKELDMDLSTALDYEATMQGIAFQTADFVEGVKAFLDKRAPDFKGR